MTAPLRLEVAGLMADVVGQGPGLDAADVDRLAPRLAAAHADLGRRRAAGEVGFLDLPRDADMARKAREAAEAVEQVADDLLLLGIGGSALGPRALLTACTPMHAALRDRAGRGGRPRVLVTDNVDPVGFAATLSLLDPRRTAVDVVSKSGETAETMAQWLIVRDWLVRAVGEAGLRERVVMTTDPAKGVLRELARREGYRALDIPASVGGRFSVLSSVGLFPAAVAGVDLAALQAGASAMASRCAQPDPWSNPAALLAASLYLADTRLSRNVVVMMSYSDQLAPAADWFAQLWAESLGKARREGGSPAHVGQTPVRAVGATDQHSQLQLYMEGPQDKVIVFLTVDRPATDLRIPPAYADLPAAAYLGGRTMGELFAAEARGTEVALNRAGRITAAVRFPVVDAHALGQFFMLWEIATAYAGGLYGVDAFDQPGVEASKQFAYGLLGRPRFEARRAEIEQEPPRPARYTL